MTTATGIEILRHSLGLDERNKRPYRNYFAAGSGTADYRTCEELVNSGHMVKGQSLGYGDYFYVTDEGKALAKNAPTT